MENDQVKQEENNESPKTEEFGHNHEVLLNYGFAKCFDTLQDFMLKKKVLSKLHFSFKTVQENEESLADCLNDKLSFLLLFVNELCKTDATVCKFFLELGVLKEVEDDSFAIIENKIIIDQKASYEALKFLKNCMSNKTLEIPIELFNNVWSLLSKNCPLHEAGIEGDEDMINWFISNKIDVTQKDLSGNTALHRAVESNNVSSVKILCEAGVPINEKNNNSYTALHLAVVKKHLEIINFLISKDCEVSTVLENGDTPLHSAVFENNLDIVTSLTSKSNNLEITKVMNNIGLTPIHLCVENGHWRILEHFISKKCDMNLVTSNFDTPLHLAVKHVSNDGVSKLLQYGVLCKEKNVEGLTPMHIAAQKGHINTIEMMVRHDFDVIDIETSDGNTPLHLAALNGHKECCSTLMKLGANKEAKNIKEESVMDKMSENGTSIMIDFLIETFSITKEMLFLYVSRNGHLGTLQLLLERLCPDEVNEDAQVENISRKRDITSRIVLPSGSTPFHLAAQFGQLKVLEKLLHFNKEWINDRSYDGSTPLMKAVFSQHFNCIQFLIENNADLNIKSSSGMTALHYSMAGDNVEIIKLLIEKGSDLNALCCGNWTPLHKAIISGKEKNLKVLLEYEGVDLNARDISGLSPLHIAIMEKNVPIIKLLLDAQADCNAKSHSGDTPLLLSLKLGFDEAAEILIESSLDLNSYDRRKATPLHVAASKGKTSIIEKLLLKGANNNCFDIYNRRPYTMASCFPEMQDILYKFDIK